MAARLFIFTASNPKAREHLRDSVERAIPENHPCLEHLEESVVTDVKTASKDGRFYAWGATPGSKNKNNWRKMSSNDHTLTS